VNDSPSLARDAVGPSTPTLRGSVGDGRMASHFLCPGRADAAQEQRRSPSSHPEDVVQGAELAGVRGGAAAARGSLTLRIEDGALDHWQSCGPGGHARCHGRSHPDQPDGKHGVQTTVTPDRRLDGINPHVDGPNEQDVESRPDLRDHLDVVRVKQTPSVAVVVRPVVVRMRVRLIRLVPVAVNRGVGDITAVFPAVFPVLCINRHHGKVAGKPPDFLYNGYGKQHFIAVLEGQ
jgi:hypothetical protein